jgi:hypothetical protein
MFRCFYRSKIDFRWKVDSLTSPFPPLKIIKNVEGKQIISASNGGVSDIIFGQDLSNNFYRKEESHKFEMF